MSKAFLSIVTPVYKTAGSLAELVSRVASASKTITPDFEIILVDDGSPDASWQLITQLAAAHHQVRGVKLSRNFGQHAAIAAGLQHATGDWVVVMDSDLQDVPEEIPRLYAALTDGTEIVIALRETRTDSFYRKFSSKLFNAVLSWLSGVKADARVANFGIYSRRVISHVNAMPEVHRFFPMIINWLGFPKRTIECKHGVRNDGPSGYTLGKLLQLALNTTLAYSDKPLKYVVKLGFVISALSFLYGIVTLIKYLRGDIIVLGYTSLIVSIWFLSGVLLFTLGVVGLYIGKTFEQSKGRPLFVVDQTVQQHAS